MTKPKLLSNVRIDELTEETDYLGIIDKGDLIKEFLVGSKDTFHEFKMFSLYGEWGSGKSSLMKYLQKELNTEFNTFFFEAWEFEKDENLAMSLLEYITFESSTTEDNFYKEVLKYGSRILRGMGKSIKFNIPLFPNGPAIELDPSAFIEEIDKQEELTFYTALKKFKIEFQRLEDHLTLEGKPKYNIVFIDDLDRCEPEQVLNLMSAIKLFFTYGKKTIFFCGIDKKAIEEAVKTKYGKVVKANEYLEKIFDVSFSMPTHNNLLKLINHYFDNRNYNIGGENTPINMRIEDFFQALEFTNPRRVKKVLNKFQMLRNFKQIASGKHEGFPNVDMKNNSERGYFETIVSLYLIILHEFFQLDFDGFLNFDRKKDVYFRSITEGANFEIINSALTNNSSNLFFGDIYSNLMTGGNSAQQEKKFYVCISPLNVQKLVPNSLADNSFSHFTVKEKYIDFLFYKYVNSKGIETWLKNVKGTSASFSSIKKIIKDIL